MFFMLCAHQQQVQRPSGIFESGCAAAHLPLKQRAPFIYANLAGDGACREGGQKQRDNRIASLSGAHKDI